MVRDPRLSVMMREERAIPGVNRHEHPDIAVRHGPIASGKVLKPTVRYDGFDFKVRPLGVYGYHHGRSCRGCLLRFALTLQTRTK